MLDSCTVGAQSNSSRAFRLTASRVAGSPPACCPPTVCAYRHADQKFAIYSMKALEYRRRKYRTRRRRPPVWHVWLTDAQADSSHRLIALPCSRYGNRQSARCVMRSRYAHTLILQTSEDLGARSAQATGSRFREVF
jgi:hypothetical protein